MSALPPTTDSAALRAMTARILADPANRQRTIWLEVRGHSMLPTLHPGDRVEVRGVDARSLRPGDLVLIDAPAAGWVIHRYFWRRRRDPETLRTKGDARALFDPPWLSSALIGRVETVEREGRRRPCGRLWLLGGLVRSLLRYVGARVSGVPARERTRVENG